MACKQENKDIQGRQVSVIQWPAYNAMTMQVRMMNTLGESSLPFIEDTWDMKHINFILTNCDINMFTLLVKDSCIGARVEGKEISASNFDSILSGDLMFMYALFAFVLEVNFKDFFVQGLQLRGEK